MAIPIALQQFLPPSLLKWSPLQYIVSSDLGTVVPYNKGKIAKFACSIFIGVHGIWKLIRMVSMSGNSSNPYVKYMHNLIRGYLNCGLMIRNEFYTQLPWQYIWMRKESRVIVNYGSYGCVPKQVLQHQMDLQVCIFNIQYNTIS